MKHPTLAVIVGLSLLTILVPASSAATYEGEILVGQPGTGLGIGASEIGSACDPGGDLDGADGQWFDISADTGTSFELTMDETLDADVWFYDASCNYIPNDSQGAQGFLGVTETGSVPSGAAFAVVDGFAGSGAFTLTLS